MAELSEMLGCDRKPALLIGNGINRFRGSGSSSWEDLLEMLGKKYGLKPPRKKSDEMSFTEFFDILYLASRAKDAKILQERVCDELSNWKPADHHGTIVGWAKRHSVPIVTVNFDENLSRSVDASFHRGTGRKGFTHWYPWNSYFSDREIDAPRNSFAIWHAHGMMRYRDSIRLGLTQYMGSVERARRLVHSGEASLSALARGGIESWRGQRTWLDVLFFSPLLIFGFSCKRDENFMRWLLVERARLHRIRPEYEARTWFLDTSANKRPNSRSFFEGLGMEYVSVSNPKDIYDSHAWGS